MTDPNVKPDEPDQKEQEIQPGDHVRIRDEALIDPVADEMTPVKLFKRVAWPNHFYVFAVAPGPKGETLLRIEPCCGWVDDEKDRRKAACQAHPAKYFERIDPPVYAEEEEEPDEEERDRYAGLKLNGEEVIGVEYADKKLVVRRMGRTPFVLEGKPAAYLLKGLRAFGVNIL